MSTNNHATLQALLIKDYLTLPEYLEFDAIDVNTKSSFGDYPLHVATARNNMDDLRLLCENSAILDVQGEFGCTPLYNCVEFNHYECAKYLLELGADPSIPDVWGETPLDTAIGLGNHRQKHSCAECDCDDWQNSFHQALSRHQRWYWSLRQDGILSQA